MAGAWHVFVYTFQVGAVPLLRIDGRYVIDRPQATHCDSHLGHRFDGEGYPTETARHRLVR